MRFNRGSMAGYSFCCVGLGISRRGDGDGEDGGFDGDRCRVVGAVMMMLVGEMRD